jgi:hypothetical protein
MPAVQQSGLISVFSIGGASQLALARGNARLGIEIDDDDYAPIVSAYPQHQAIGRSGSLSAELTTLNGAPVKTSTFQMTTLSIGGVSHLAHMEEGELTVEWAHQEGKGGTDEWAFPTGAGKDIRLDATLMIPTAGLALPATAAGARSGLSVVASLDLGNLISASGLITWPALLKVHDHEMAYRDLQRLRVTLVPESNYPTAGFPTAPAGFTTLLEKAINGASASDPWPALAFSLTTKATPGGAAYSGNMLLRSMRVPFGRGRALSMNTEWATQGAVTVTSPN